MTECILIEPPIFGSKFGVMRQIASIGTFKSKVAYPPLDLMIISGLLNKHNISNKIYDSLNLKHNEEDIKKIIEKEKPRCVVFTTTAFTIENDVKIAEIAKSVDEKIITIPINIAMESSPYNLLEKFSFIDFVPFQDPELPVLHLIQNSYDGSKVGGIYWGKDGKIIKNKDGNLCFDLDSLGIPDHGEIIPYTHLYEDYLSIKKPMTMTICSRGCKNQCYHCLTRYLNPLRYRSIESMEEEFNLIKKLGIKEIKFLDCELPFGNTPQIFDWAKKLFEMMIRNNYNFSWFCNARADCIPYDILKLMKEAGCHTICMGADSSSQEVLDSMGKNERVEDIEEAAENIKKLGMRLMTFVTMGFPAETKETMHNTINWIIHKIKPDITSFSLAVPIRGTVFYNYLKKKNYLRNIKEGPDWDPSRPPIYNYPNLSSQEMFKISVNAYRRFYLRPSFILKRLMNLKKLPFNISAFLYFLRLYFLEARRVKKNFELKV
jgi:radical SAM superfamily enzyme YgiQ (UPF0313 family)